MHLNQKIIIIFMSLVHIFRGCKNDEKTSIIMLISEAGDLKFKGVSGPNELLLQTLGLRVRVRVGLT